MALKANRRRGPLGAFVLDQWKSDPFDLMERWADEVRVAVSGPPYDPVVAASRLGVTTEFQSIAADGLAERTAGRPPRILIGVEQGRRVPPAVRRSFVVAHELGHHVLRGHFASLFPATQFQTESEEEERLCNRFAAALLMPKHEFRDLVSVDRGSPELYLGVARRFGVSIRAALRRVREVVPRTAGPFAGVLWNCDLNHPKGDLLTKEWGSVRGVAVLGDVHTITRAARSDGETARIQMVKLGAKQHRVWCRTVSVSERGIDGRRSRYQVDKLLTIFSNSPPSRSYGLDFSEV